MARKTIAPKSSKSTPKTAAKITLPSPSAKKLPTAPRLFLENMFANVLPDDLTMLTTVERQRIADSVWHFCQHRNPGQPKLRIFNPSPLADGWTVDHTVLEVINDDMPFLVDSITGALQKRGLTIHFILHPVMYCRRDKAGNLVDIMSKAEAIRKAETHNEALRAGSLIHIQFDHCLDNKFLKELETEILAVLADVRASVEAWPQMRQHLLNAMEEEPNEAGDKDLTQSYAETQDFLHWLDNNNFTYLGYRDIDLEQTDGKLLSIAIVPGSGLGVLRHPELRVFGGLRDVSAKNGPTLMSYARQKQKIFITKTNISSKVHRCVPMDAIFIRRFDQKGQVIGERLFVGLFTSQSYSQNPRHIPLLRQKIERLIERAKLDLAGHDGKSLVHILNNYPHDELFQMTDDELFRNALGILQLQERARVALFTRIDPFGRFITCLIYVPRDHYDSDLRMRFQKYLETSFGGKVQDWHVRIDDSMLARAFVSLNINSPALPDTNKIEADLREMCRNWSDRLRDNLAEAYGEATALALLRRYGNAFPDSYCDVTEPATALRDIHYLERCKSANGRIIVDLTLNKDNRLHLKLLQSGHAIALSEILPLIENTGMKIEYMGGPYEIKPHDSDASIFIHEFVGHSPGRSIAEFQHVKPAFEEAFERIWRGDIENDPFNALTLQAGLSGSEIILLRAFARYLRQLRIPYSHEMMAQTFVAHPLIAQKIVAFFLVRHNPELNGSREQRCKTIEQEILDALAHTNSLEEDRIIRRYLNLVQASLRTNFFQTDADGTPKTYVSIKFDSRAVDFMPLPKPLYEIFVYSPRVEAIHLRGGKIARGGIRWSDRREDFRNEILGLMKAQMVKNSVIVPVGSKGGFIVKRPPQEADKFQAEGIACYRIMMCGLLDITDNRKDNKIIPPTRVVRHDADDPYLVVAADKGTAKFSDIANSISQEYKFWLDDAFASGGSAGYDHKNMAITARGAWEAVKRHFRELGKDIQTTDFTCVGVGDMSGDVFGNGMLLSVHIRLIAAFDHRHIFCDPNPDSAISFAERQRLFKLPRSSWADYDSKKISKGGGVFARSEKSIRISPEMKKAYGITADTLTPSDLAQAILKADVELLYFGGIGTYIKATDETHEDVGDRSNEALRVDSKDIRAKVIGEGANLGMTQRGRIEYALKGGRLNTDAIDNSAGVDTSDHEVNIKILLRKLVDNKSLTLEARNKLLGSMTDNVAALVLRDNYLQTQALSVSEMRSAENLQLHVNAMHALEKSGLLNRAVEFLPNSNEIAEYKQQGRGLTRPELAVMLAYAKIWLYEKLLNSDLPDDPFTHSDLINYFPETLQKKFPNEITKHQLSREIIATVLTNSTVNRGGTNFVLAMVDQSGKDAASVTRAFLICREALSLRDLWYGIEALDNKVAAKVQIQMHAMIREALDQSALWFLSEIEMPKKLSPAIASYREGIEQLELWLSKNNFPGMERVRSVSSKLMAAGVPEKLAHTLAKLPILTTALDILRLAFETKIDIADAAEAFFGLEQRLSLDWLTEQTRALQTQTPWQREAAKTVLQDIRHVQRRLTEIIVKSSGLKKSTSPSQKLLSWLKDNATAIERYDMQINEWRSQGAVDIAILTLASRQLRTL
jgi:glutamate dehydrogenase